MGTGCQIFLARRAVPIIKQGGYNYFVVQKIREAVTKMESRKTYPIEEAVQAQKALRTLGGLGPEAFPVEAFVGMISDEIEQLRKLGHSDEDIANTIKSNSKIQITAAEIAENYAPPEERHPTHE